MHAPAQRQMSLPVRRLLGGATLLAASAGILTACALDVGGTGPAATAQGGGGTGGAGASTGGGDGGDGGGGEPAVCGDGRVQPPEACDDGGVAPGDGCSAACAVEPGFTCDAGEPSACTLIEAQVVSAGPGLDLDFKDGGYNGSLDSMACVTLDFPDRGFTSIQRVELVMGIDHGWVGDLIVRVESPANTPLTVVSRPGVDEDVDGYYEPNGDSSDISKSYPITFRDDAPYPAESLGDQLTSMQTVCRDDRRCDYAPSPGAGPGESFADFNFESPVGTWRVCAGDGDNNYGGSIDSVKLSILAF